MITWCFLFQESFCRDDYLIALNEYSSVIPSDISILSSSGDSTGNLELTNRKASRHGLFRFESHNLKNEQWVIRTWDGRHLAVDQNGNLTVKVSLYIYIYIYIYIFMDSYCI